MLLAIVLIAELLLIPSTGLFGLALFFVTLFFGHGLANGTTGRN